MDSNGGHNDRKRGGYHCHREPCISQQVSTQEAIIEALTTNRNFSYIYNRNDWKHWSDFDDDCMNTRHEILQAQADGPIVKSTDGCRVTAGIWDGPFSGGVLIQADDLDIDHIVPLKWASDHGGGAWAAAKKEQFANDPVNLLAVDDGLNQSKGARGPTEWLPPNQSFHCGYLGMWEIVLNKYASLQMTSSEKKLFTRQLLECES